MSRFGMFLTVIDTPGGHMAICLFVIGLGALFTSLKIPKGEDLIIAGSATLFQAMRGKGAGNHLAPTTSETVTVATTDSQAKP